MGGIVCLLKERRSATLQPLKDIDLILSHKTGYKNVKKYINLLANIEM